MQKRGNSTMNTILNNTDIEANHSISPKKHPKILRKSPLFNKFFK